MIEPTKPNTLANQQSVFSSMEASNVSRYHIAATTFVLLTMVDTALQDTTECLERRLSLKVCDECASRNTILGSHGGTILTTSRSGAWKKRMKNTLQILIV
jgi:hypothetical protein